MVRRPALVCLSALSLAGAVALACSSFESGAQDPGDASVDALADSCVSCGQETGPGEADARAGDPILEVSAGGNFACVRRASKTVFCWGRNNEGQIGQPAGALDLACDDPNKCRPTPLEVPGLTDVTHLSAGVDFACVTTSAGEVKCWGQNNRGNLGLGVATPTMRPSPALVPGLPPALDVVAGAYNACARVTKDGATEVYCWGSNGVRLLGLAADGVFGPTRIAGLTGAKSVALDLSGEQACAILADDAVACWGHNNYGGLGHSTGSGDAPGTCPGGASASNCNPTPTIIAGLKAAELAVGNFFGCARAIGTGLISCWGYNGFGLLGRGGPSDQTEHPVPMEVPGLGPASALAGRDTHACAIVGGTVHCWGAQQFGELGNGNTNDLCGLTACKTSPQTVAGIAGAIHIYTGSHVSFADTADGSERAWGANGDGRLGHPPGQSNDLASCTTPNGRCNPVPQPLTLP